MKKVTLKVLHEQIDSLKSINRNQSIEINNLNEKINNLSDKEKIVSKTELGVIVKNFENQKLMTADYKKLYQNLRNKKEPILNERNAGRKAYADKQIVTKIYTLYVDGKSLQGVADELNRLEIKTNRGKQWSKSTIRFILLNSKNVLNQLIEENLFKHAVQLLNDNKK